MQERIKPGADLRGANLLGADLRRADLRWANLRRAILYGADLRWADLRQAIGIHTLTHTQHGYTLLGVQVGDHWTIQGGCRKFTIPEARAHWGSADYPYKPDAERILLMIDWLEKQPTKGEKS